MLVFSRKLGQRFLIGGDITVTVVEIRGDKVRLGIEAPRNVPIAREEVARVREIEVQIDDDTRLEDVVQSIEVDHLEAEGSR